MGPVLGSGARRRLLVPFFLPPIAARATKKTSGIASARMANRTTQRPTSSVVGCNAVTLFRTRLRTSEIARASSSLYLDTGIPEDPAEALEEAVRRIHEAGWTFYDRLDTFHGRKYTMTLRRRIGRSAEWSTYNTTKQAGICWHELVHIRQRQHLGHTRFLGKYTTPFGRWEVETPAYRQNLFAYETMSRGALHGTRWADAQVTDMRSSYWLGRINRAQYVEETTKILYKGRLRRKD